MQIFKKALQTVRNINRASLFLEDIQRNITSHSALIDSKLSELITVVKSNGSYNPDSAEISSLPAAITKRTIKPLEKIAMYSGHREELTYQSIQRWYESPSFMKIRNYFHDYPSNSLIAGAGRELLYHLVRSSQPKNVLEVGTYYAGTSEVIARALWENNGGGVLHTTDPYGVERCPAIIAQWPKDLKRHIQFYPLNSMDFFSTLEQNMVPVDIAFIDGNHDFPYAYFDLTSAARLIQRGGIIVLDNVEQPGPFWAAVEFTRQNPEWVEVGDGISGFNASNPFDASRFSIAETSFIILKAPPDYVIKSAPVSTGQLRYAEGLPLTESQVRGIKLDMSVAAPRGILHAQVYLRGFAQEHDPEQLVSYLKAELDGQLSFNLNLEEILSTTISKLGLACHHTVEIVLFWQPLDHNEPLRLKEAPKIFA